MKNYELKVNVSIEREDGYKEVTINCGYDTTASYTNFKCVHLNTESFVASCVKHYIKNVLGVKNLC